MGVCQKAKTFNLQFKKHEIGALKTMILNSMPQMSQRCTTDCSYGDLVEKLNPRTLMQSETSTMRIEALFFQQLSVPLRQ